MISPAATVLASHSAHFHIVRITSDLRWRAHIHNFPIFFIMVKRSRRHSFYLKNVPKCPDSFPSKKPLGTRHVVSLVSERFRTGVYENQ
jgi:hypothetical protein